MSEQFIRFSNGAKDVILPADMTLSQLIHTGIVSICTHVDDEVGSHFLVCKRFCKECHSCVVSVDIDGVCEACSKPKMSQGE
jgi:hypothetical protein